MTDPKKLAHFEALYPNTTREKELSMITDHIKHGNSLQVVGLPGTGRSTILSLLAYNKAIREKYFKDNTKWNHCVYMDFSEVKDRSLFDVLKFILISLSYSLLERDKQEEQEKINLFLKEALEFQDDLILFQALKKSIDYLAIERELTVIFLFDRFDQYLGSLTADFFSNLRILRNRAKYRFSAIFSLNRPLQDIVEPSILSDFYDLLIEHIVYVSLYDPAGMEFRLSYIDKLSEKTLSEDIRQELLKITGGHGKLMKVSYEALLAEDSLPQDISSFLLTKNTIQGALTEIWQSLLPEEQAALRNNEGEKEIYLTACGLLKSGEFTIPLFQEFIKTLPTENSNETIQYDAERNEIHKGNIRLSDLLSPSEFRLLRYLVQNPDKICEKEEIINAVWKDQETLQGVTDQALDQIVYRLRKKIEFDPNNPLYIHTIKGRGYKFSNTTISN